MIRHMSDRSTLRRVLAASLSCVVLFACSEGPAVDDQDAESANLTGIRPDAGARPDVEPIVGYGDYSDVDFLAIDREAVTRDVAACVADQGLAVEVSGNSLSWERVPAEQLERALEVAEACEAGLNLPPPRQLSREEFEVQYERQVAVAACLEELGLPTTDPPSLDVWIADYASGPWAAYDALPRNPGAMGRATSRCPEHPPGGYGTWRPGDPVTPAGR